MTVQTSNNAGTSNIATLQVVDTTPTAMLVNGAVVGGNNLAWSFGGTRNSLWALVVGSVGTTSPLLGLSVLDNPTVLTYGLLSPFNGLGSYTTFVPANQLSGLRIYSQVVELDLANNLHLHLVLVVGDRVYAGHLGLLVHLAFEELAGVGLLDPLGFGEGLLGEGTL
jgi:hypothetical protein